MAQARAANEGVPIRLWIDPDLRMYGIEPEYSLDTGLSSSAATSSTMGYPPIPSSSSGNRTLAYPLAPEIQVEHDTRSWASMSGNTFALQFRWAAGQGASSQGRRVTFRFTPDGGIDETSPWGLWFRLQPDPSSRKAVPMADQVYVSQNFQRTRYEVQTNQLAIPFR